MYYLEQHVKKVFLVLFQALVRLNKLGVTMSPKSINKALDLLGEDFDLPIKNWKGDITAHLEKRSKLVQEGCDLETRKGELVRLAAAGANRPIRLTQCCTQFKSPRVKILCVLYLHYNVAFTFK